MNAFTFTSSPERLHEFLIVYKSLRKHHPDEKVYLLFAGSPHDPLLPPGVQVISYEGSIDCTSRIRCMQATFKLGATKIIALDNDMFLYSSLQPIFDLLDNHNGVVTPHNTEPLPDDGRFPAMETIINAGNYNSGFFACRNTPEVQNWLNWWLEQSIKKPSFNGNYGEQNWLRFIGDYLDKTFILRHSGYNAAYWNITQRSLYKKDGIWHTKDGPLVIFHFSGLDRMNLSKMSIHQNRYEACGGLLELFEEYSKL